MSLRRLGVERIDLFQLHRIDTSSRSRIKSVSWPRCSRRARSATSACPRSNVEQLEAAQKVAPIVSVQNMYNLTARTAEPVLDACEAQGLGFIPWFPLAAGPLAAPDGPLQRIAAEHHATASQLALAWLLKRSPVMLPIPGTSKVSHLEQNVAAAEIKLSDEEFETLSKAGCGKAPQRLTTRTHAGNTVSGWPPTPTRRMPAAGSTRPNPPPAADRTTAGSSRPSGPCRTTPARPTPPTT